MSYSKVYESNNGGWVFLHEAHGKKELPQNLAACKILADHGYKIEMLPCYNSDQTELRMRFLQDVHLNKNPDVRIILSHSAIGDIKTPKHDTISKATINSALYYCGKQKVSIAIINLYNKKYATREIKKGALFIVKRAFVFDDTIYEELDFL